MFDVTVGNGHLDYILGWNFLVNYFYIYFMFYSDWSHVSICVCVCACMWHTCFPVLLLTAVVWWLIFPPPNESLSSLFSFLSLCIQFFFCVGGHCWLTICPCGNWDTAISVPQPCWARGFMGLWVLGTGLDHWRSSLGGKECWEQLCVSSAELQCLIFSLPFISLRFSKSSSQWHETPLFQEMSLLYPVQSNLSDTSFCVPVSTASNEWRWSLQNFPPGWNGLHTRQNYECWHQARIWPMFLPNV